MKPLPEFYMEAEQCERLYGDSSMSWWLITLITVGSVWLYVLFASLCQRQNRWDIRGDGPIGLLWPFILPWNLGEGIANRVSSWLHK